MYDRWHRHDEDPSSAAYVEARTESYRLKAIARQAMFRVKLLSNDEALIAEASEIMKITEELHHAPDSGELEAHGKQAQQIVDKFISAAAMQVQGASTLGCALRTVPGGDSPRRSLGHFHVSRHSRRHRSGLGIRSYRPTALLNSSIAPLRRPNCLTAELNSSTRPIELVPLMSNSYKTGVRP